MPERRLKGRQALPPDRFLNQYERTHPRVAIDLDIFYPPRQDGLDKTDADLWK